MDSVYIYKGSNPNDIWVLKNTVCFLKFNSSNSNTCSSASYLNSSHLDLKVGRKKRSIPVVEFERVLFLPAHELHTIGWRPLIFKQVRT